jgi:hypothetical protein
MNTIISKVKCLLVGTLKKTIYILLLFTIAVSKGQDIEVQLGYFDPKIKTIVPIAFQQDDGRVDPIWAFGLQYPFFNSNKNITLGLNYSYYKGWTEFSFDPPNYTGFLGFGVGMLNLRRVGIKCQYKILYIKNGISFIPFLSIDYEARHIQEYGGDVFASFDESGVKGDVIFTTKDGFQIVPSIGASIKLNLFWKFFITGNIMYSFGFDPYQKLFFEHSLNNVKQKTAEWHTDGTGLITSFGVGIKLWEK